LVHRHKFAGFTNYKLYHFIRLIFHNYKGFYAYRRILYYPIKNRRLSRKPVKYNMYESNIEPLLRCMHIRKLDASGWVKIPKKKYHHFSNNSKPTHNDVNIYTDYKNLYPIKNNTISSYIIASFDIECTSGDGGFPQANRDTDKVIQIGTTFNRYGNLECYYKHIITLGSCDPIDGADVESYDTEKEVLLAWKNLIIRMNPDILTGYNIFGFDYKYLMERSKKVGCSKRFSKLGRLMGIQSDFIEKDLSSAALGNNILYYYNMQGRIQVDMLKEIKKGYKFRSYKLDNVAEKFIRDKINNVIIKKKGTVIIETNNTCGLTTDRYIKIIHNDGLSDNAYNSGEKFKVIKLTENSIVIRGVLNDEIIQTIHKSQLKLKYNDDKVFWCQAKDDVKPTDIFKLQKGTSADRSRIARYCIAEGTQIMLRNSTDCIENLYNCNKNEIISWDKNKNGLVVSPQNKFFDNGMRKCIELMLEDGTTLTCTEDHKILTSNNEWIEAGKLKINEARVKTGFTYPEYNINEEIKLYPKWEFMNMDLTYRKEYRKTMAYMRILGYVLTDGSIFKNRANVYMGTRIDAENISEDIKIICGESYNIRRSKYTYDITIPRIISKRYLQIPGITIGARINQDIYFPDFILDKNCPLPVIREFLGGLFGGDGSVTCFKKYQNNFSQLGFSQTKSETHLDSLKQFMKQLSKLLLLFGIESNIHNPLEVKTSKKEKHYSLYLSIKMKCIPLFEKKIGFRYCVNKNLKLAVVASYYKLRESICNQYDFIVQKTIEYKNKHNCTARVAVKKAHAELKRRGVIFNNYYSLPNYELIRKRIQMNKPKIMNLRLNNNHFISAKDFLIKTGSLKYFMNNLHNKCTHAIGKEDKSIPTYNLTVIGRKSVGLKHVYDMEIDKTHSYLANGIICHNCLQDCMLCNILMEKLQVLINNISMSKVSSVPLSYIFLRGQGIKILSLVAKKCRERLHLIPHIKKKYKKKEENYDNDNDKETKVTFNSILDFISHNNKKNIIKYISSNKRKKKKKRKEKSVGYEGATVLRPHLGLHESPIVVLDYGSLYPSSMIHRNISHECLLIKSKYDNLEGYTYYTVTYYKKIPIKDDSVVTNSENIFIKTYNIGKKKKKKKKEDEYLFVETKCRYAKKNDGTMGILPEILKELLDNRAAIKKEMKKEKDPFKKMILNGLQLAYKITANSLYGITGAPTSAIYKIDIAGSTTGTGREMLNASRIFAEDIYPLILEPIINKNWKLYKKRIKMIFKRKIEKLLGIETINKLKKNHYKDNNDENDNSHLNRPSDYYYLRVFNECMNELTDDDFINKKLNHKSMKDFIRYFYIEVRKLLKNKSINPLCVYGDSISATEPILLKDSNSGNIIIKTIENLCNEWKSYNQFKNGDSNRTNKEQNKNKTNYMVWNDSGWTPIKRIIRHKCKKKIYRICTSTGCVDVTEDHSLLDINKKIIKPTECKIGTQLLSSFPKYTEKIPKLYDSKYDRDPIILKTKNKLEAMKYYFKWVYYYDSNVNINIKDDYYILSKTIHFRNINKITNIIDLGISNNYVYDIETKNGRFNAGIGDIVVKNTDSIFINFNIKNKKGEQMLDKKGLKISILLGVLFGYLINYIMPHPQKLNYEKTFYPWIILAKKKYTGYLYEFNPNKFYLKNMGIVLKRRDNAIIVQIVVGGIVHKMLRFRSGEKAIKYTEKILKKILAGKYSKNKFIITKTIRGPGLTKEERDIDKQLPEDERPYKDRNSQCHVALADKLADRDPGSKPQSNERIPFVYIETKKKVSLQGDKVEHPDYLDEYNLKIDYLFYITNQIMKPSIQFLEKIIDNPEKIFHKYINEELNNRKGKLPISHYFQQNNSDSDSDSDSNINIFDNWEKKNKKLQKNQY